MKKPKISINFRFLGLIFLAFMLIVSITSLMLSWAFRPEIFIPTTLVLGVAWFVVILIYSSLADGFKTGLFWATASTIIFCSSISGIFYSAVESNEIHLPPPIIAPTPLPPIPCASEGINVGNLQTGSILSTKEALIQGETTLDLNKCDPNTYVEVGYYVNEIVILGNVLLLQDGSVEWHTP